MKGRYVTLLIIGLLFLTAYFVKLSNTYAAELPVIRIGIVRDGPVSGRLFFLDEVLRQEIAALTSGEFDVRFPPDKIVHGNWSLSGIKDAIDRMLNDSKVDFVITLGSVSSNEICKRKQLPKPVIAPIVIDPVLQGLPQKRGTSGVKNLNYLTSFTGFERDIEVFRKTFPFTRLAVIIDELFLEAFSGLQVKFNEIEQKNNIKIVIIPAKTSSAQVLAAIPADIQAVMVTPLVRFSLEEFDRFIHEINKKKLPSFSMFGRAEVERDVLMSISPASDLTRLFRRVALNVQRILLGEDAGTIPIAFPLGEQLTVNMATARIIGFSPGWTALAEAELLHEEITEGARRLTLSGVMREAITVNLDIAAANRAVAAGREEVRKSRATLFPQMEVSAQGLLIDEDRAKAGLGSQAERTFSGAALLRQLIYSEKARANFDVQHHIQTTREEKVEQVRLDIALAAAVAYLNVLKAKTFEGIQKDNIRVTRSNLDFARFRQSIGISGPADVYRWESKIATDRQAVLEAGAQRKQAETALNRILHRPLEELFIAEKADLTDPLLLISDERFFSYIANPRAFRILRDFLVQEGLAAAPELRSLKASIAALERTLVLTRRAFWLPTFALQGNVDRTFSEGGGGVDSGLSGPLTSLIPQSDDTDWSVALTLTFPLFTSGEKSASLAQAKEELSQLQMERQSFAERIGENIRSVLHQTGSSFSNIELSRDAAEAAQKNFKLVTDSYVQGVVSIVDLLDAQNAALIAGQGAANAVYDFLIDLMKVQRSVGQFDLFMSSEEREEWFAGFDAFIKKEK